MAKLGYFTTLIEQNNRIKELSDEIKRFNNNKLHLRTLKIEQIEAQQRLDELSSVWEKEYVPAVETRQELRSELDLAKTQPDHFSAMIEDKLKDLDNSEIESLIEQMQDRREWTTIDLTTDLRNSSNFESPFRDSKTLHKAADNANNIESRDELPKEESASSDQSPEPEFGDDEVSVHRHCHRSWSLASASHKLEELEKTHAEISGKKRSLGNRTCELTVLLKSLQVQIVSLENAMQLPPKSFFSAIETELRPYQLQCYRGYLNKRRLSTHTRNTGEKSTGVEHQSPTRTKYDVEIPHTPSKSSNTTRSTKSWAASVGTSMTELSQVGSEILKITEGSLSQIVARWS